MYNISKGQLWVVIIGGIIIWFASFAEANSYSPDWWGSFGAVVTPFLLIFYVIGWRNHHKKLNSDEQTPKATFWLRFTKKKVVAIIIILVIGSICLSAVSHYFDRLEQEREDVRNQEEYVGKLKRYSTHLTNAQECVQNAIDKELPPKKTDCDSKFNTAYSKYNDCVVIWNETYCSNLYENNYKQYDCATTTLSKEIEDNSKASCYITVKMEYMDIIQYEENLTRKYLESLPLNKSSLTTQDLENLKNQFPAEVFDDKTLERIKERVTKQGYQIESP